MSHHLSRTHPVARDQSRKYALEVAAGERY
jgi:hypothetical protein